MYWTTVNHVFKKCSWSIWKKNYRLLKIFFIAYLKKIIVQFIFYLVLKVVHHIFIKWSRNLKVLVYFKIFIYFIKKVYAF